MSILKIIKEEVDDSFDWIRNIKTNDTIAKEIYDKLNWIKRPNATTDYVTNPWNKDIPFLVQYAVRDRASAGYKDKEFIRQALITPSSFHQGFKDYVRENYGIFYMSDIKEVFYKIKELMGDKVRGTINESDDFDWIKDTEPRKSDLDFRVGDVFYVGLDRDDPRFLIEIVYIKDKDVQYKILEIGPYEITNTDEKVGEIYDISYVEVVQLLHEDYWSFYKKVDEPISESEDLSWIRDVKSDDSVRFDEDKLYYFNPPLTRHEILDLMERIPNEIRYAPVKKWFDGVFLGERPHKYMSYFSIVSDDLDESFNVGGWCDETRWSHASEEYYEEFEPINGRDKFFGHYRIG